MPREAGLTALREARALIDGEGWRISFPVEIRDAPADDIALSTASAGSRSTSPSTSTAPPTTRVLPRGRADPAGARRPPALGQAAHPHRRRPGPGVPPVRGVPGRARPARPGPGLRQRLPAPGARGLSHGWRAVGHAAGRALTQAHRIGQRTTDEATTSACRHPETQPPATAGRSAPRTDGQGRSRRGTSVLVRSDRGRRVGCGWPTRTTRSGPEFTVAIDARAARRPLGVPAVDTTRPPVPRWRPRWTAPCDPVTSRPGSGPGRPPRRSPPRPRPRSRRSCRTPPRCWPSASTSPSGPSGPRCAGRRRGRRPPAPSATRSAAHLRGLNVDPGRGRLGRLAARGRPLDADRPSSPLRRPRRSRQLHLRRAGQLRGRSTTTTRAGWWASRADAARPRREPAARRPPRGGRRTAPRTTHRATLGRRRARAGLTDAARSRPSSTTPRPARAVRRGAALAGAEAADAEAARRRRRPEDTPDPPRPSRGARRARPVRKKRGRASVPSWDEIMFGGRRTDGTCGERRDRADRGDVPGPESPPMSYFVTGATGSSVVTSSTSSSTTARATIFVLVPGGLAAPAARRSSSAGAPTGWSGGRRPRPRRRSAWTRPGSPSTAGTIDHFFHLAAIYDMTADDATNEAMNVGGTRHAVELADALGAGCFHQVSSVAAAGEYHGQLRRDDVRRGPAPALALPPHEVRVRADRARGGDRAVARLPARDRGRALRDRRDGQGRRALLLLPADEA